MRITKTGWVWSLAQNRHLVLYRPLVFFAIFAASLAIVGQSGCAGLVSGSNTTGSPALNITNVQAAPATTSTSQIVWTTNVAADSGVDYGTSPSYGSSTPVDSAMLTSHQVTLSGLAAGTTYYYQVSSTDSKGNSAHSGGHSFKTPGFSISGTISPATGGSGATLTLSGAANTTTTADSSGNYTFTGLANGTYTITPSHTGFTFTPSSQSTTVNGANLTGVNFTDNAAPVAPTITTQPTSQTVTAGQTATFTVVAAGTAPLSYQWQKSGVNIAGATAASYTTPATTTSDSGSTFTVVVSNTAGTVTSAAATLTVATLTLNISPTSLSFGNITTGTSSAPQTVTITNTGNSNVTISQISVSGAGYSITGGGTPVTLSPLRTLTLTAVFSPTGTGSVNGSISIVSNANGSPASVSLSGTGVAPVQHSVALTWNASTSTVSGYNVYRSTVSGTGYTKLNSSLVSGLAYTDSSVQNATTYFYVTTAVDSSGNESTYSNEAQAVIP